MRDTVTGFNISRHINKYVKECDDRLIGLLQVPVRINCVFYTEEEALYANKVVNRFKDFEIITGFQFRDNYIGVGYDNLYNCYENGRLDNLLKGLGVNVNDCKFHFSSFAPEIGNPAQGDCVFVSCWTFLRRLRTGSWSDLHVRVWGFVRLFCLRTGPPAPGNRGYFRFFNNFLTKKSKKVCFSAKNFEFCVSNI